jgi:hypothetical protein
MSDCLTFSAVFSINEVAKVRRMLQTLNRIVESSSISEPRCRGTLEGWIDATIARP